MPEGAEVRIIADGLQTLVSERIIHSRILSGRYERKGPPVGWNDWHADLNGKVIKEINTHGKFLYFKLSNDWCIFNTLGMSGTWHFQLHKHARIMLKTDNHTVYFIDTRNFGTFKLSKGTDELIKKTKSLGWDPLKTKFITKEHFRRMREKQKSKTLPEMLMNQALFAGVGNYIKSEALYRARLSPHTLFKDLDDEEVVMLCIHCYDIIHEAYTAGGASARTYTRTDGSRGSFQDSFAVYGRKETPDGLKVIKETTADGRTTHWCPSRQF